MACMKAISLAMMLVALPGAHDAAAQHATMPPGMTHEEHLAQMKTRGADAMGFDQDSTQHHFHLTAGGGAIDVAVKDAQDTAGRQQIRTHLREIAAAFARGNFERPLATHDELPAGAKTMQRLKAKIAYTFEETAGGGRVRIETSDRSARSAVHEFLRYQIVEHRTGDPLTVACRGCAGS
jgi:hypothetical protein